MRCFVEVLSSVYRKFIISRDSHGEHAYRLIGFAIYSQHNMAFGSFFRNALIEVFLTLKHGYKASYTRTMKLEINAKHPHASS